MSREPDTMTKRYLLPRDLLYTSNHEWTKLMNGRTALVGLTDYAFEDIRAVGYRSVLHIELPHVGKRVNQAESMATIETEKTVTDVSSPLSGEILEVNEKLKDDPTLIGSDPYGQGWIVKLRINNAKQVNDLMDSKKYQEHCDKLS